MGSKPWRRLFSNALRPDFLLDYVKAKAPANFAGRGFFLCLVGWLCRLRGRSITLGELALGVATGLWLLWSLAFGEFAFGIAAGLGLGVCKLATKSDDGEGCKAEFTDHHSWVSICVTQPGGMGFSDVNYCVSDQ